MSNCGHRECQRSSSADCLRVMFGPPSTSAPHPLPFVCPVCYGKGRVSNTFYEQWGMTATLELVLCRSCAGTGIVWG